ncbi:MAG: hypothetical protein IPJ26_09110 [Bacteroidetes bacterium]|nr:hypothetical protein [Bacteroidota bacterium]
MVVLPLQPTANLYVDSCWLSSPIVQLGQALEFTLSIQNSSEKDAENVPVRLMLNGTQKAVTSLTIPAGQKWKRHLALRLPSQDGRKQQ